MMTTKLRKNNLKTFYAVVTSVDDRGYMTAAIVDEVQASKKPENKFTSTSRKDIYTDWFDNYAEARQMVEDARRENGEA